MQYINATNYKYKTQSEIHLNEGLNDTILDKFENQISF